MLQAFSTSATRVDISSRYRTIFFPSLPGEGHGDYEARAVSDLQKAHAGFDRIDAKRLRLPGVQSDPDGLFLRLKSRELIIIEAKKHQRDFADGTAQLVQYYAQAKHSEFSGFSVQLILVTSKNSQTSGYALWEQWLKSHRDFAVFANGQPL